LGLYFKLYDKRRSTKETRLNGVICVFAFVTSSASIADVGSFLLKKILHISLESVRWGQTGVLSTTLELDALLRSNNSYLVHHIKQFLPWGHSCKQWVVS
jgi:hypothetical protein